MEPVCDLVLPVPRRGRRPARRCCRASRRTFAVIVVDNGSRDGTAEVARRRWAPRVVHEPTPGYGAAVHAGLRGRDARLRRVHGRRRLLRPRRPAAAARRRPVRPRRPGRRPPPPGRARRLALARARRQRPRRGLAAPPDRHGRPRHRADAGAAAGRRCSTWASRTAGSATRSSCCRRATDAGWRVREQRRRLPPARRRHAVEGVRLGARAPLRTARDFWRVLAMTPRVLVVAKAPVAGRVKTRLGADGRHGRRPPSSPPPRCSTRSRRDRGGRAPAAVTSRWPATSPTRVRGAELRAALAGWTVHAAARRRLRRAGWPTRTPTSAPGPVVQVGMDTPQLTAATCCTPSAGGLDDHDAVLGAGRGRRLVGARAARPGRRRGARRRGDVDARRTCADTRAALERGRAARGATPPTLRDVDTVADADVVARPAPASRFAEALGGWSSS